MTATQQFPRVPASLKLIPYPAKVGEMPVELYGSFCRFSKEFEAEAIAINVGGQVIDLTDVLPQRLLDSFNFAMRSEGIGAQYAAEQREDVRAFARDEHCYAGVGA